MIYSVIFYVQLQDIQQTAIAVNVVFILQRGSFLGDSITGLVWYVRLSNLCSFRCWFALRSWMHWEQLNKMMEDRCAMRWHCEHLREGKFFYLVSCLCESYMTRNTWTQSYTEVWLYVWRIFFLLPTIHKWLLFQNHTRVLQDGDQSDWHHPNTAKAKNGRVQQCGAVCWRRAAGCD